MSPVPTPPPPDAGDSAGGDWFSLADGAARTAAPRSAADKPPTGTHRMGAPAAPSPTPDWFDVFGSSPDPRIEWFDLPIRRNPPHRPRSPRPRTRVGIPKLPVPQRPAYSTLAVLGLFLASTLLWATTAFLTHLRGWAVPAVTVLTLCLLAPIVVHYAVTVPLPRRPHRQIPQAEHTARVNHPAPPEPTTDPTPERPARSAEPDAPRAAPDAPTPVDDPVINWLKQKPRLTPEEAYPLSRLAPPCFGTAQRFGARSTR